MFHSPIDTSLPAPAARGQGPRLARDHDRRALGGGAHVGASHEGHRDGGRRVRLRVPANVGVHRGRGIWKLELVDGVGVARTANKGRPLPNQVYPHWLGSGRPLSH